MYDLGDNVYSMAYDTMGKMWYTPYIFMFHILRYYE